MLASDLWLNRACEGDFIRLPVPQLTEERRKEFIKIARKHGEECKVSIRNARRDSNDLLKDMESSGDAPKDDVARALKKIQEMTDEGVAEVDKIVQSKEAEISEI